jgi:hypothetical protein
MILKGAPQNPTKQSIKMAHKSAKKLII